MSSEDNEVRISEKSCTPRTKGSPSIPDAEDKSLAEIGRYGPYKILPAPRGLDISPLGPQFPGIRATYSPQTSLLLHYQPETLAFRSIFLR